MLLRLSTSTLVFSFASLAIAEYNDGIRLAIKPTCKPLNATGASGDTNAGLNLKYYKTIVRYIIPTREIYPDK